MPSRPLWRHSNDLTVPWEPHAMVTWHLLGYIESFPRVMRSKFAIPQYCLSGVIPCLEPGSASTKPLQQVWHKIYKWCDVLVFMSPYNVCLCSAASACTIRCLTYTRTWISFCIFCTSGGEPLYNGLHNDRLACQESSPVAMYGDLIITKHTFMSITAGMYGNLGFCCRNFFACIEIECNDLISLAPGGFDFSLILINFKLISTINILSIFCEIAITWMPQHLTDHKATLVQVMAWRHQATSHYLSQCWPNLDLCCHMVSLGHNELIQWSVIFLIDSNFIHFEQCFGTKPLWEITSMVLHLISYAYSDRKWTLSWLLMPFYIYIQHHEQLVTLFWHSDTYVYWSLTHHWFR